MKYIDKNQSFLPWLAFMFLTIHLCYGQGDEIEQFIPEGYVLFENIEGDLNADGRKDHILVIKATKKQDIVINRFGDTVDRNRRGILIVLDEVNGYQIVLENRDCFTSENEEGGVYMPPTLSIYTEDHLLHIHYGHGRYGYWKYVFKMFGKDLQLIAYEASSNRGPVVQYKTDIDFLKKKKTIAENINSNSISGEEKFEVKELQIEVSELIKLSEIENFDKLSMLEFEIVKTL